MVCLRYVGDNDNNDDDDVDDFDYVAASYCPYP